MIDRFNIILIPVTLSLALLGCTNGGSPDGPVPSPPAMPVELGPLMQLPLVLTNITSQDSAKTYAIDARSLSVTTAEDLLQMEQGDSIAWEMTFPSAYGFNVLPITTFSILPLANGTSLSFDLTLSLSKNGSDILAPITKRCVTGEYCAIDLPNGIAISRGETLRLQYSTFGFSDSSRSLLLPKSKAPVEPNILSSTAFRKNGAALSSTNIPFYSLRAKSRTVSASFEACGLRSGIQMRLDLFGKANFISATPELPDAFFKQVGLVFKSRSGETESVVAQGTILQQPTPDAPLSPQQPTPEIVPALSKVPVLISGNCLVGTLTSDFPAIIDHGSLTLPYHEVR